jgi:hypothetical protein
MWAPYRRIKPHSLEMAVVSSHAPSTTTESHSNSKSRLSAGSTLRRGWRQQHVPLNTNCSSSNGNSKQDKKERRKTGMCSILSSLCCILYPWAHIVQLHIYHEPTQISPISFIICVRVIIYMDATCCLAFIPLPIKYLWDHNWLLNTFKQAISCKIANLSLFQICKIFLLTIYLMSINFKEVNIERRAPFA